jgi:hypothetical protein
MTNKCLENESPLTALTSDAARQRWELFHRAIAHAKQSNCDALSDEEAAPTEHNPGGPLLTIIR